MDFAKANLIAAGKTTLLTQHEVTLPGDKVSDKATWSCVTEFLLTKEFTWRKSFNINMGFPAPSSTKDAAEKQRLTEMKQRMSDLIESLSNIPGLAQALEDLSETPPHHYEKAQWETLQALYQVLRIVVAQLKVTFQKHGKIDYIENAYAALQALGSDETPTDLALALDYQVKHILIDEFQDTSNSQFRLLNKLIAGWENNDGRTLFIVGDPMQSIYRFREAEVGLFIGARKKGINQIELEPLTLSVNFRSTVTIVDWVNHHFAKALPAMEDISSGAVSYSHSLANAKTNTTASNVDLHPCLGDDDAQAKSIVTLITSLKEANPQETIAILVRSRSHLESLIPAMKAQGLLYRAIDIDALTTRSTIQDLMMLTRALLNPNDRIAWLAILRAPWCGLLLEDLWVLGHDERHCIAEKLFTRSKKLSNALSEKNLVRVTDVLKAKLAERKYHSLRDWVESTWLLLGGPACLSHLSDLEDTKTYFNLLDNLSAGGDLLDLDQLARHVSRLFASPHSGADNTLQIMTIHNAKGLEFDTVILPQLQRRSAHDDKQLMLWMERHGQAGSSLLLAPIHATGDENDSIYAYIKKQHDKKADHETGRLLYVAATRAKKNLHLFFNVELNAEQEVSTPNASSLLNKIWDSIKEPARARLTLNEINTTENLRQKPVRKIQRLSAEWKPTLSEIYRQTPPPEHQSMPGFQLEEMHAKQLGTVVHLLLQKISQHGISWWTTQSEAQQKIYLHTQLLQIHALSSAMHALIQKMMLGMQHALQDTRLQWVLKPHQEAQSEWSLTTLIKNKLEVLIIDRTFVDEEGVRWVIDYKTSAPVEGQALTSFLQAEQRKYQEKMRLYFQALKATETREIRMGLYFPLVPAWHEWSFETSPTEISEM